MSEFYSDRSEQITHEVELEGIADDSDIDADVADAEREGLIKALLSRPGRQVATLGDVRRQTFRARKWTFNEALRSLIKRITREGFLDGMRVEQCVRYEWQLYVALRHTWAVTSALDELAEGFTKNCPLEGCFPDECGEAAAPTARFTRLLHVLRQLLKAPFAVEGEDEQAERKRMQRLDRLTVEAFVIARWLPHNAAQLGEYESVRLKK